jgi:hypothetical protein
MREDAHAQALRELEEEDRAAAAAAAAAAPDEDVSSAAWTTTTKVAFRLAAATGTAEGATASSVGDVPQNPITAQNPGGDRVRLGRTNLFTEGMLGRKEIDNLIATRQL